MNPCEWSFVDVIPCEWSFVDAEISQGSQFTLEQSSLRPDLQQLTL